ncbi:MAG: 16S rRNA (cytidine(1402)-2'-O)-methyltransferase [Acidobacteria bacterium]|nr:16S rRNA (cytidine(1402)-2'-O)-methyltransferase [Acidobacteriota bacterium]
MVLNTAGILYLVATPIGNLEDITLRALRVLRECDLVAAEDTRHTAKLLHHFDIRTPTTSVHEHNEHVKAGALVEKLQQGHCIALVSDAGTPAVSDPGFRLVQAAIAAGIRVEAIPGPSAVLTALVSSGLPTDAFVFVGFPPVRAKARATWLEILRAETRTVVFFEAPHRIVDTLNDALRVIGDRQVAVGRELTKLHEELVRGPISDVLGRLTELRGEFTIVMAGRREVEANVDVTSVNETDVYAEFCRLTESGLGRRAALSGVASKYGLRSRDAYAVIERVRNS